MKTKSKLLISLALLLTISSTAYPVNAISYPNGNTTTIQPRYSYINSASANIVDNENDTADFSVRCSGSASVTSIKMDVILQKRGILGIYSKVDSASKTVNKAAGTYTDTFDIDSSETYRIKYTYTVYTANDSESDTMYSDPT